LARLTKLVLDASLEGEMNAHLGYSKHDPAGRERGQLAQRRPKSGVTEVCPVEIDVPRGLDATS
jgi:putative transposase